LSQYPGAIISKALHILGKNPHTPRTFSYFLGIIKKLTSNNANVSGRFQKKYRLENDPYTGIAHAISLEEEAHNQEIMKFAAARNFVERNTCGSKLRDAYIRTMMGIRVNKKEALEELLFLGSQEKNVMEFLAENEEINDWRPDEAVAEIEEMIEQAKLELALEEEWAHDPLHESNWTYKKENTSMPEDIDIECSESDYEAVNTHTLFEEL